MDRADAAGERLFSAFQGHGSPKKSKIIWLHDAKPDPLTWLTRLRLKRSLKQTAVRKRFKNRTFNTGAAEPKNCVKRFLEFQGIRIRDMLYACPVHLISSPGRYVYELAVNFEPFCTFTDWREAEASFVALRAEGFTCGVAQFDLHSPL